MIYTSFLQLRHYLKTHKEWVNICKTPSKLEELLIAYTEGETKKGVILKLCKILQQQSNNNNLDVKEKWELEANIIITDEQWEETFKAGHKVTNSPTWREFDWKIKMKYFITRSITSRYSNPSKMCWRGCGLVGDFTHRFGDCRKILDFWNNIQKEIKHVMGIDFTLTLHLLQCN